MHQSLLTGHAQGRQTMHHNFCDRRVFPHVLHASLERWSVSVHVGRAGKQGVPTAISAAKRA